MKDKSPFQRPLDLQMHQYQMRFDDFFIATDKQKEIINTIKKLIQKPRGLVLTGRSSAGKTHLLKSFAYMENQTLFIPAKKPIFSPEIIENTENRWLVIDDCHHYFSHPTWEAALFKRLSQNPSEAKLIISVCERKNLEQIKLPDLKSRLQALLWMDLPILTHEQCHNALVWLCAQSGFKLGEKTIHWINTNLNRDNGFLFSLIKKAIEICASKKQNPSIHLIKDTLNEFFSTYRSD